MKFEVTILGTSSAIPTASRFTSAHVLNAYEHFFLIDCGEGVQMQLRKYRIKFSRIDHIFISHLHGDHYLGLFGLLYSFDLQNRKNELHIYAPEELRRLVRANLKYAELSFPLKFHYLKYDKSYKIFENKTIEVHSFPVKHRINTCGFLFQEKEKEANIKKEKIFEYELGIREIVKLKNKEDIEREDGQIISWQECTLLPTPLRSYAYITDTIFHPPLAKWVENVSLLYHEATFIEKDKKLCKTTMHSTAKQAAQLATLANAKSLILGHYSARYNDLNIVLKEAQSVFKNTKLSKEGNTFKIPTK